MVGDRLETDIAAGANAGALTCLIRSSTVDPASGSIVPDYEFLTLGGLQAKWENQLNTLNKKKS